MDQNPLGQAGGRIARTGNSKMWLRQLTGDSSAVILMNRSYTPADITAAREQVGYPATLTYRRNVSRGQDLGTLHGSYTARAVPPHGVIVLRATPTG